MRVILLLTLLLPACSGEGAVLDQAADSLRIGNLDRAEAMLGGVEGVRADHLRAKVQERRRVRAGFEGELAELYADYASAPLKDLKQAMRRRLKREVDPILQERLRVEMSRAEDDRAEARSRLGHVAAQRRSPTQDSEPQPAQASEPSAPRDPVLDQVVDDVRLARERQSWAEALGLIGMVLEDAPSYSARLAPIQASVESEAAIQGRDLLRQVAVLEGEGRIGEARALLVREAWRYPSTGACAEIHRRVDALKLARSKEPRGFAPSEAPEQGQVLEAEPVRPGPAPLDTSGLTSIDLAVAAVQAEGRDQYRSAADLWGRAAEAASLDRERARYELRGFGATARHALRESLAAAHAADAGVFRSAGVEMLTVEGLRIGGEAVAWADLAPSTLYRIVESVELSAADQVGLALEKLALEDAHGRSGGLADLHRAQQRGTIDQRITWHLVAAYLREPVPDGGYEWKDGEWISSYAVERAELGEELEAQLASLVRGDTSERDSAFEALLAQAKASEAGRRALDEGLRGRFARTCEAIEAGSTLTRLGAVADLRTELDRRREHALELIFDEVEYFYPYSPPAPGTGKTVGDYYPVQREVDVRVGAVEEIWERSKPAVQIPKDFQQALADLSWIRERHAHIRGPLLLNEDWPEWLPGLDPTVEAIDVQTFCWSAGEREGKAYDRRVRAWNEERWTSSEALQTSEKNQVRITNAYREMFGRRALAWNEKIQVAAQWHSDYMANTGNFGHIEPEDPENRTPFDRMRRVGYPRGASENCHRGSGDPQSAHTGWCHSSGHHRNLLQITHTEMASGLAAGNWTQNFGRGSEFKAELEAWRN